MMSLTMETATSRSGSVQWVTRPGCTILKRGDSDLITISTGEVESPTLTISWILLQREYSPKDRLQLYIPNNYSNLCGMKRPRKSKHTSRMPISIDSMPIHFRPFLCPREWRGFWDSWCSSFSSSSSNSEQRDIFLNNQSLNPSHRDTPTIETPFPVQLPARQLG